MGNIQDLQLNDHNKQLAVLSVGLETAVESIIELKSTVSDITTKLSAIETRLDMVSNDIKKLADIVIYGSHRDSLISKISQLEDKIQNILDNEHDDTDASRYRINIVVTVVAAVTAIVGVIIQIVIGKQ